MTPSSYGAPGADRAAGREERRRHGRAGQNALASRAPARGALRPRSLGRQGQRPRRSDPARRRGSGDDRRHAQARRRQRRRQDQWRRRRRLPAGDGANEGQRDQRLGRDAGQLHGPEHVDPDRDVVPHRLGRHARNVPRRTERRPQRRRPQREDLVHAPHRVRDRAGGERTARHVRVVPARERQTAARRSGDQPRSGRRFAAQGRLAHARRAGDQGRRHARLRAVPRRLRRPRRESARCEAHGRRTDRRDFHADESGRHRHDRFGAATDDRSGHDRRCRRDRVSAGLRPRARLDAQVAVDRKSHDDDVDLRSSHHSRRGVGRVPQAHR